MTTTYRIENDRRDVLGYYKTLSSAKEDLKEKERIVCLKGGYFGEGFHRYEIWLVNGKFKRRFLNGG